MRLNNLHPAEGSVTPRRRVGRGGGSGLGKTCGRGDKGQKSRSGGYHKTGFEGGQMPLQRRLPKRGFRSQKAPTLEVRLNEIGLVSGNGVNLQTLKAARIIPKWATSAKIVLSGEVSRALNVSDLRVTAGARQAIEAAGGTVADFVAPAATGKFKKAGDR